MVDRASQASELVLVLGTYRPAVTVVRALARRGRRAVVGREPGRRHLEGSAGVEFSRHTTAVWDHPSIEGEPGAFLDALVRTLAGRPGPVHVLPLEEATVVLLARERSRLPADTFLASPATETVITCVDKERCLHAAGKAGLSVPPWEVVGGYEKLLAAANRAAAPVVVKPLWPHSRVLDDHKAIICRDSTNLARRIPIWPTGHDRLLVQRFAAGPRHNLIFAARHGELLDVVEVLVGRTNRRDGTGFAVAGHTCPVSIGLRDQLAALVAHLRYTGVGCGQFLVPPAAPDGAFLELNPRIDGAYVIADHAGLDLANLAVDLAADVPIEPRIPALAGRDSHTFAWTFGDLVGLRYAIGQGEISRAGALVELGRIAWTAVLADVHLTWSWRDPVPTIVMYWRHVLSASLRLIAAQAKPAIAGVEGDRAGSHLCSSRCPTEAQMEISPSAPGADFATHNVAVPDGPNGNGATRKTETVTLVIPAKNEAGNIAWVLEQVPDCVDEIILVDGNSTDATLVTARFSRPDVRVVTQQRAGKGDALRAGFLAASGDILVMMDADGSMSPQEIPRFLYFLHNGYDFVKGSRFTGGGGSLDITRFRRLGNRGLLFLVNRLHRTHLTDLCYGFCAFHRRYISFLDLMAPGFEIEAQMTISAVQAGLRIAEVPSFEMPRRHGRSNLRAIRDGTRVLRTVLREHRNGVSGYAVQTLRRWAHAAQVTTAGSASETKP